MSRSSLQEMDSIVQQDNTDQRETLTLTFSHWTLRQVTRYVSNISNESGAYQGTFSAQIASRRLGHLLTLFERDYMPQFSDKLLTKVTIRICVGCFKRIISPLRITNSNTSDSHLSTDIMMNNFARVIEHEAFLHSNRNELIPTMSGSRMQFQNFLDSVDPCAGSNLVHRDLKKSLSGRECIDDEPPWNSKVVHSSIHNLKLAWPNAKRVSIFFATKVKKIISLSISWISNLVKKQMKAFIAKFANNTFDFDGLVDASVTMTSLDHKSASPLTQKSHVSKNTASNGSLVAEDVSNSFPIGFHRHFFNLRFNDFHLFKSEYSSQRYSY